VARLHYRNETGRNELLAFKVARDQDHVYFYACTKTPITPWHDPHWMMLLIDSDQDPNTGWHGFDLNVNRTVLDEQTTAVERYVGEGKWERVAEVPFRVKGSELHLAIPRAVCGLAESDALSLDFKWVDNAASPLNVMDFYVSGDVAPLGRFKYRYTAD
jgi:hypothetical protein